LKVKTVNPVRNLINSSKTHTSGGERDLLEDGVVDERGTHQLGDGKHCQKAENELELKNEVERNAIPDK
jgi:hypothetical protein